MFIVGDTLIFTEDHDNVVFAKNHSKFYSSGLRKIIKLETEEGFCVRVASGHRFITDEGFSKSIDELKKGDRIQMFNKNMDIPLVMNSIIMNTEKIKEYQILFLQNNRFMVYDYINNFLYERKNTDFCSTVKHVFTDGIDETFSCNLHQNFYTNGFLSCNIFF